MKSLYIFLVIALITAGCNKFDSEINTNPNLPTQASNTQLIANAQLYLPNLSSTPQGEYNAQFLAETQYPNLSLYNQVSFSFYDLYQGPLMNLETVIRSNSFDILEGPAANQLAVAKILKAYFFWFITDRWGDVPYTEALKGSTQFRPKYDRQQDIYDSLFKLLDEANAAIVAGNITNDIMYGGDITKWKKFGNTIHMLMALRLSKRDAIKGASEFNKALTAGVMASNNDNFVYKHLAEASNQNYWYGQIFGLNRQWWALSKTLVDYMLPNNDPRLAWYGDKNSAGNYVGLTLGQTTGLSTTAYSLLGKNIWLQNAPVYLVTYAQALFAIAEAAKLGWITGGDATAKTNYDLAITQSVSQWTGSTTGVSALLASTAVAYDPARALEQIAMQRYVHLFMNGYEAWAEWRRTGYPNNLVSPGGTPIPRRQGYPSQEFFVNADNYKAAIQAQFGGQDNLTGRVWWDKP